MQQSFQDKVNQIVKQIPAGKVATYKQIAELAGNSQASRAVGMCMSNNRNPQEIPCHRVVASNGNLTGYAFGKGVSTKKEKLEKEGVSFINDRVDLSISQWKPTN
jgi:methylated-DNA-protein-cysteine methyltransferase related protein